MRGDMGLFEGRGCCGLEGVDGRYFGRAVEIV